MNTGITCPACGKETEHETTLYNPDNPSLGEVWRCLRCGNDSYLIIPFQSPEVIASQDDETRREWIDEVEEAKKLFLKKFPTDKFGEDEDCEIIYNVLKKAGEMFQASQPQDAAQVREWETELTEYTKGRSGSGFIKIGAEWARQIFEREIEYWKNIANSNAVANEEACKIVYASQKEIDELRENYKQLSKMYSALYHKREDKKRQTGKIITTEREQDIEQLFQKKIAEFIGYSMDDGNNSQQRHFWTGKATGYSEALQFIRKSKMHNNG